MKSFASIDREEAWLIIDGIITYIKEWENEKEIVNEKVGSDAPVAVAVVNATGGERRQDVMDGALQISSDDLAYRKAYTAVTTKQDGKEWSFPENVPVDNDPRRRSVSGSVILKAGGDVVGAVGVSGRQAEKNTPRERRQDQELAELSRKIFEGYLELSRNTVQGKSRKELIDIVLERIDF